MKINKEELLTPTPNKTLNSLNRKSTITLKKLPHREITTQYPIGKSTTPNNLLIQFKLKTTEHGSKIEKILTIIST